MANKNKAYKPKNEGENLYKIIPGTNGKYEVSRDAVIRKINKNGTRTELKPCKKASGRYNGYVIRFTINGKRTEHKVANIVSLTYNGVTPKGYVIYHKNGCIQDDHAENIGFITRKKLAKRTARNNLRNEVVFKIDVDGNELEVYSSAREAAKKNYVSYQTVLDRCHHRVKNEFALDGYSYRFSKELENYQIRSGRWLDTGEKVEVIRH